MIVMKDQITNRDKIQREETNKEVAKDTERDRLLREISGRLGIGVGSEGGDQFEQIALNT